MERYSSILIGLVSIIILIVALWYYYYHTMTINSSPVPPEKVSEPSTLQNNRVILDGSYDLVSCYPPLDFRFYNPGNGYIIEAAGTSRLTVENNKIKWIEPSPDVLPEQLFILSNDNNINNFKRIQHLITGHFVSLCG